MKKQLVSLTVSSIILTCSAFAGPPPSEFQGPKVPTDAEIRGLKEINLEPKADTTARVIAVCTEDLGPNGSGNNIKAQYEVVSSGEQGRPLRAKVVRKVLLDSGALVGSESVEAVVTDNSTSKNALGNLGFTAHFKVQGVPASLQYEFDGNISQLYIGSGPQGLVHQARVQCSQAK